MADDLARRLYRSLHDQGLMTERSFPALVHFASREEALRYFGAPEPLPRAVLTLLQPWSVGVAQSRFLARFAELNGPA